MGEFDDLGRCRRTAELIIDDGIREWARSTKEPARRDEHETLLECRTDIRNAYRNGRLTDDNLHDELRTIIEQARLVLAAADYDDRGDAGPIAAQFPDDVLETMLTLDGYRQYDVYDADNETLQRRIASKDGKLDTVIREEVAPQLTALNEALTGTHSELSKTQMAAVEDLTSGRLDRLQEAVGLYLRYNGLPNVRDEIEEAVLEAATAADRRADIVEELSTAMDESLDEFARSLNQGFRDERRELTDELHRAMYGVESGADGNTQELLDRVTKLLDRQQEQQEALQEQIELHREKLTALAETTADIEALLSDGVDEQYENLLADELDRLREQRAAIEAHVDELRAERAELESTREELETDRSTVEGGRVPDHEEQTIDPVYATDARIAEFDYSSRFETAVHESPGITLPDGETFVADSSYWTEHHVRSDDRERMRRLLSEHREEEDAEAALGQYPLGRRSRFTVEETGRLPFTEQQRLVLELRVYPHLTAFARDGRDTRPATESDLLTVVNDVVRGAETAGTEHVVAIASPTGWTDGVETTVARGTAVSFSRYVEVVLVDLDGRRLVYDDSEPLVDANADLFTFESRTEAIDDCVATIRSEYVGTVDYVSLDRAVAGTDHDEYTVSRAFARLEDAGVGARRQYDDDLYFEMAAR